MTYKDKLLDPKWQKKRLKILERDDFSCKICNDKEKTLHVHHLEYNNNGEGEISIAIYSVYLGEIFPSIHLREKTIEKLDKMIKDVKRPSIPVL